MAKPISKSELQVEIAKILDNLHASILGRGQGHPLTSKKEAAQTIISQFDSYLESLIGVTEVVPADFEKLLPNRQEQMDYKSRMWARNEVRAEIRNRLHE